MHSPAAVEQSQEEAVAWVEADPVDVPENAAVQKGQHDVAGLEAAVYIAKALVAEPDA